MRAHATEQPLHKRAHVTEQPRLCLYDNYNGVIDTGTPKEVHDFLVRLDYIKYNLRIMLQSKRERLGGCNRTLDEMADTGVLDIFDNIVCTSSRTSHDHHDHHGAIGTEHHIYDSSRR